MDLYKTSWLVWIAGTILIVLCWNNTVSAEIGWVGFAIALIGVVLSFIPYFRAKRRKPRSHPPTGDDASPRDADPGATGST